MRRVGLPEVVTASRRRAHRLLPLCGRAVQPPPGPFVTRVLAALQLRHFKRELSARPGQAAMLRRDLILARAVWLESFKDDRQREEAKRTDFLAYVDASGRSADFHALRHTY